MHEEHNKLEPRELMRRAKMGDSVAFGALYDAYYTPVYRYVFFRVGNREEAEDIVQTVFLKVFNAVSRFEERENEPLAYFFTVARNTLIDYWKKKRTVSFNTQGDDRAFDPPDRRENPHESAVRGDDVSVLKMAVGALSPEQQEVTLMHYLSDVSYQEIARILGKTEPAVRQIQSRALKALRRIMGKEFGI